MRDDIRIIKYHQVEANITSAEQKQQTEAVSRSAMQQQRAGVAD